jgi:hypothetical protein
VDEEVWKVEDESLLVKGMLQQEWMRVIWRTVNHRREVGRGLFNGWRWSHPSTLGTAILGTIEQKHYIHTHEY